VQATCRSVKKSPGVEQGRNVARRRRGNEEPKQGRVAAYRGASWCGFNGKAGNEELKRQGAKEPMRSDTACRVALGEPR